MKKIMVLVVVVVLMVLTPSVLADAYTLSSSGVTSYLHAVQSGGGGVANISNTYTVMVPEGMVAKVSLVESGDGFVWHGCETSTFYQRVNGSLHTLQNRTTELLSTATISLSMTCSPAVLWTEIPRIGSLNNGMPRYGHYIYHPYTYYYAKMNYLLSVSYEKLLPDLVVSSIVLSSTDAAVDETVTLTYTVRNAGRKNSTASLVRIYDGDNQICGDQSVPALSPGASSVKTITLPELAAGKHTLKVVADASKHIDESYEGNNESTASLRDYTRTPVDVTFDTNGGAQARNMSVIAGDKIGVLPVPFRKGYEFDGWWTEPSGGYRIEVDEKVTMTRMFYAHWTARTSSITFNQQGGSGNAIVQATYDELLPMVSVPVREGHVFDGYWTGVNGTGVQYYAADGRGMLKWNSEIPEVVLYAKWTGVAGVLQLDVQGGTGGSRSVTAMFESAMPSIVLPTRSGWSFQGYYSSPNGEGVRYYTASGTSARIWDQINESAVTLYAHWLPNKMTYSLILDRQDGSGGSASVTATYAAAMPTIDVPTRAQYAFEGYFSEPNGGGVQYYAANGESVRKWDVTPDNGRLYAKWSKAYRVKLEPNGASGTAMYAYFTEMDWHLPAIAFSRSGYVFAGWSFEPDGVPTFPDGARVNKTLLGYGGAPDAETVTLYAVWGKPLTVSTIPGVRFVTGGKGDNPCWYEAAGKLRSAECSSVSWLCAIFENRGELGYVFENTCSDSITCAAVWAADDKVYTNLCASVNEVNESVTSGRRSITFVCNKELRLKDWGMVEPTEDSKEVLWSVYGTKTNSLETVLQSVVSNVTPLLRAMSYYFDSSDCQNVESSIRLAFDEYKEGEAIGDIDMRIRILLSNKGFNVSQLRKELEGRTSLGCMIRDLCDEALSLIDDINAIENYCSGCGMFSCLSWKRSCIVGFVLDEGENYGRALTATNRIVDVNILLENTLQSIFREVTPLLRAASYYFDSSDCQRVESLIRQAFDDYREGEAIGDIDMHIRRLLSDPGGFNVSQLRKELENWTSLGCKIRDLFDEVTNLIDDIASLERQIQGYGVLQWKAVRNGDAIGVLPVPQEEEGCRFAGWWSAADGGTLVTEKMVFDMDSVVYAHWEKITYTLSFITGTTTRYDPCILDYDEPIGELPTPIREGYTFGGWIYLDNGKSASVLDYLSADVTLVAQWTRNSAWEDERGKSVAGWKLSVSFDANGGTSNQVQLDRNDDEKVGTLPIPVRNGYRFDGWFSARTGGTQVSESTVVRGDVMCYAHWTANTYVIRFMANGGVGTMVDQTVVYDIEKSLDENRFKRENMHFAGWSKSVDGPIAYKNREKVKNLSDAQGSVIRLYAIWTDGIDGLYPDDAKRISENAIAPYATAAGVYDGYLRDADGNVTGTIQLKVAKGKVDKKTGLFSAKVTATVVPADGSKKISFKGGLANEHGNVTGLTAAGHALDVMLGTDGLGGSLDGQAIDGARNFFAAKDAAAKTLGAAAERAWVGAVNVVADGVALSVVVAKKGKVKVSGTVNGVKVSATSQLLVGEESCSVPVVIAKKAKLAFNLWLMSDGSVEVAGLDGALAAKAGALKPGAKFTLGESNGTVLPGLLGDYLPNGLAVAANGTKWAVADGAKAGKLKLAKGTSEIDQEKSQFTDNMSGLKLTYKAKDGSFKGSFKAYAIENGKLKGYSVTVTGVMVGDVGYGTATIKKPAVSWPVVIE